VGIIGEVGEFVPEDSAMTCFPHCAPTASGKARNRRQLFRMINQRRVNNKLC